MRIPSCLAATLLALSVAARLPAQAGPDPAQPRPPLLLEASRTERLETAVRMHLIELTGALQRADTVALASLIPANTVPAAEVPVSNRAGCPSIGRATARLRAARAGESQDPKMPLSGLRIGNVRIVVATAGDTVASLRARILERRGGRTRYAPIEILFTEANGAWQVLTTKGALVGLCGLASTRE